MRRSTIAVAVMGGALLVRSGFGAAAAPASTSPVTASPGYVEKIEVDEARIYVHDAKKIEVRAIIAGTPAPAGDGAHEKYAKPRWNLVEVDREGRMLRYLGVLFFNPRRGVYFRKLELQEREPGYRYFEVVPDAEFEPFVARARPRLEIEVLRRPTLVEILRGLWRRIRGEARASEDVPVRGAAEGIRRDPRISRAVAAERPCRINTADFWEPVTSAEVPAGSRVQHGALPEGGVFAALRAVVDFPASDVADQLWEPANLKNPSNTRVKVAEAPEDSRADLRVRKVDVNLRPFLFVNLDWQERWERRELEPRTRYRIEYRKVSGDERLRHFCGWMEVRAVGVGRSEVTFLEEVEAPRRSATDVAEGHVGTIRMLSRNLQKR